MTPEEAPLVIIARYDGMSRNELMKSIGYLNRIALTS